MMEEQLKFKEEYYAEHPEEKELPPESPYNFFHEKIPDYDDIKKMKEQEEKEHEEHKK